MIENINSILIIKIVKVTMGGLKKYIDCFACPKTQKGE
jgi:hypothetical protein